MRDGRSDCDDAREDERVREASMAKRRSVRNAEVEAERIKVGQYGCCYTRYQKPSRNHTLSNAEPDSQRNCSMRDDGRHEYLASVRKGLFG